MVPVNIGSMRVKIVSPVALVGIVAHTDIDATIGGDHYGLARFKLDLRILSERLADGRLLDRPLHGIIRQVLALHIFQVVGVGAVLIGLFCLWISEAGFEPERLSVKDSRQASKPECIDGAAREIGCG